MAEYIEREAVLEKLCSDCVDGCTRHCAEYTMLKYFPAADVRPVVRGKWVQVMGKYDWMVKCSRCNGVPIEASNFCPCCGADMREES